MFVLQEEKGEIPILHFAFAMDDCDLKPAAEKLESEGIETTFFPTEWLNGNALYFRDPNGHSLEFSAFNP